jgi:NADPH-dependent glutamate synthase beta subunit-like oxidoreductase
MRYNYYFEVKNQQRDAMMKYAKLPGKKPHEVCLDCPGYCEDACNYGVKTQTILASAHHNLGWDV